MRITSSCRQNSRCHVPLIEICDTTSQIKLDLGSCGICHTKPSALLLVKDGCPEYEVVCEQPDYDCCGLVVNMPPVRKSIEKPRPSIIYPLHEIDPQGMSVFVLDGKMKQLGYGRWRAFILVADDGTLPTNRPVQETDYVNTGIIFDIEYRQYSLWLQAIETSHLKPNLGEC